MDWKIIVTSIIIGIILYSVVGVYFLSMGTTIYDDIPENEFTISSDKKFTMIIQNNAPLTFPYVEPLFLGQVKIINSSKNATCMTQVVGGNIISCESHGIDLATIPTGESKTIEFTIKPNGGNFTIEMDAFSNFIYTQKLSKQKIVEFVCIKCYGDSCTYKCKKY
jgi:hypothetical protein